MSQDNRWGVEHTVALIGAIGTLVGIITAFIKTRSENMRVSGEQRRADDESGVKMATEVIKILREELARKDKELTDERERAQHYWEDLQTCREHHPRRA